MFSSNLKKLYTVFGCFSLSRAYHIESRKYFYKAGKDDIQVKNDDYVLIVEEKPLLYREDDLNDLKDFSYEYVIGLYKNTLVFVNRDDLRDCDK